MTSVRPYTREDYDQVARLFRQLSSTHRQLYGLRAGAGTRGGRYPDRWFNNHLRKHGQKTLRVAEEQGRVVGVVGIIPHRGRGEVEPLVVASNVRKRGIARLLVLAVTQEARRKRWKTLTVGVAPRNKVALQAFHSLGFQILVSMELQKRPRKPVLFDPIPGPRIEGRRFQL